MWKYSQYNITGIYDDCLMPAYLITKVIDYLRCIVHPKYTGVSQSWANYGDLKDF